MPYPKTRHYEINDSDECACDSITCPYCYMDIPVCQINDHDHEK